MSMLFGSSKPPAMAPVPAGPSSAEQEQARLEKESEVMRAQKLAGRSSTIVGGMTIEDEDPVKGALAPKKRAAATELG